MARSLSYPFGTIGNMCSVCERYEERQAAGTLSSPSGGVAQLEERLHGMQEVRGFESLHLHPFHGISVPPAFLGGVVAGEGCFTASTTGVYPDGSPRRRFVFLVTMASRDRALLVALRSHLGFGSLRDAPGSRSKWLPTSTLTVNSRRAHFEATIPFGERYLPAWSAKRRQFEGWRDALIEHDTLHPTRWGKGPSICDMPDCERPVRGRGLCRRHYYRATGY